MDDVVLPRRFVERHHDFDGLARGGAGVAVKKSTGMTDASLAGYYGVAFLEVYSDAPEMASIEDHVTVDFFGVTDTSEVNVTVVDEYYDDDGELWIDLRFPAPSGITISNLVFEGYDFNAIFGSSELLEKYDCSIIFEFSKMLTEYILDFMNFSRITWQKYLFYQ